MIAFSIGAAVIVVFLVFSMGTIVGLMFGVSFSARQEADRIQEAELRAMMGLKEEEE